MTRFAIDVLFGVVERLPMPVKAILGVWTLVGLPVLFIGELNQNVPPIALAIICGPAILFWMVFVLFAAIRLLERLFKPVAWLIRKLKHG